MNIADRYRAFLANMVIQEYLLAQTIPSLSNLQADLNEYDEWFTDMSKPMSSFLDLQVDERDESSAELFNEMQQTFLNDLSVLYQQVTAELQDSGVFLNRNIAEIQMLKARLKGLEDRVEELLLQNKDTEGYYLFFTDTFNSLQYIDTLNTTAQIDLKAGIVAMKEGAGGNTKKLNLNFMELTDLRFQVITRSEIEGATGAVDKRTLNAFKDGDDVWRQNVTSLQSGNMTVELIVDIGEDIEISKIEYESFNDSAFGLMTVAVQYSIDNYNWFDFPSEFPTQNIYHKGVYTCNTTEMRYIRFTLTKAGYDTIDEGRFVYLFGAKHIDFYGISYDEDGGQLQSQPLFPAAKAGQDAYINRVSIEACEDVPPNTDILYSVSFDAGETWVPVSPINRADPKFPQVASLNKIQLEMSAEVGTTAIDGVVGAYDIALDYDAEVVDAISTTIWRNVGEQGVVSTVRKVQRGWIFDDEYYSCYVWVENFYGLTIDMGDTVAELDGASITGLVTIPYGRHFFRTRQHNWRSLGTLTVITAETKGGTITDSIQGAISDKLYPFNHKYLIEGIPYDTSITTWDNQVYFGVDVYAGLRPALISSFDILNNAKDDDYVRFAKRGSQFIVKYDPGTPDVANEKFKIQSFTSAAENLPETVIIRANFTSDDGSVTPILYDYKVKFDPFYEAQT
ncbi:MAG: discoidin domain-containing protein [Thermoplasmata archaeon]|nr:discoidin domain-containing protein [Thermoplasmata archaeon]